MMKFVRLCIFVIFLINIGVFSAKANEELPLGSVGKYSPDGTRLAVINPQTLNIIDTSNMGILHSFDIDGSGFVAVDWSPDGHYIIATMSYGAQIWDADTGEPISQLDDAELYDILWSPDGTKILTASVNNQITVWDAETKTALFTFSDYRHRYQGGITWSPDSQQFMFIKYDNTLVVVDAITGEETAVENIDQRDRGDVRDIRWASTHNWIALNIRSQIEVWDLTTGELLNTIPQAQKASFSHDDSLLATISPIDGYLIQIWDMVSGEVIHKISFEHSMFVHAVDWSADDTNLAVFNRSSLFIWDLMDDDLASRFLDTSLSVSWSPNGERIASGTMNATIHIWDVATGENLMEFVGHGAPIHDVAWSPDGASIASGSEDGSVKVWDAETGVLQTNLSRHAYGIRSIAWSPDGTRIASGGEDESMVIWDVATGEYIYDFDDFNSIVWSVTWSPDGNYVAAGLHNGDIVILDATSGDTFMTIDTEDGIRENSPYVSALSWSPDGGRIAAASSDVLRLWNVNTGESEFVFDDFYSESSITSIVWSSDGQKIATSSGDHIIRIWDANTGTRLHTFVVDDYAYDIDWSPDETQVVVAAWQVYIWDVDSE